MSTTYSAFFSSGLLAAPKTKADAYRDSSKSPTPTLENDIELDIEIGGDYNDEENDSRKKFDRDITPTPHTYAAERAQQQLSVSRPVPIPTTPTQDKPRLRKRKSSVTLGSSPISAIRSPARNANNALQATMVSAGASRTRSGSVTSNSGKKYGIGLGNVATHATSLVGRMRSGSVGANKKLRQVSRRLASMVLPAPPTPPPSAPLPAIPSIHLPPSGRSLAHRSQTAPVDGSFDRHGHANRDLDVPPSPSSPSSPILGWGFARGPVGAGVSASPPPGANPAARGRERALSLSAEMQVDEEMKEV